MYRLKFKIPYTLHRHTLLRLNKMHLKYITYAVKFCDCDVSIIQWISRRQSELLLHWILMHIHIWKWIRKWMHITCDLYYAIPRTRQNDWKKTFIFQHKLIFPLFTWPNQIVNTEYSYHRLAFIICALSWKFPRLSLFITRT